MKILFPLVLGFVALFTGCASVTDVAVERRLVRFEQVQVGATKESLLISLGHPQQVLANGMWHWEAGSRGTKNPVELDVRFDAKDVVAGVYRYGGSLVATYTPSSPSRLVAPDFTNSQPVSYSSTRNDVRSPWVVEIIPPPYWLRE